MAGVTWGVLRWPEAMLQTVHALVAQKLEVAFLEASIRASFVKTDVELRLYIGQDGAK